MKETENQTRLRRAKETLAACREAEAEARKVLASAVESTRRAKERHEELFALEEQHEIARRRADYRHTTN